MNTTIKIPGETYKLLQARAEEMQMTPDQVAETIIRLQLGNMVHIEQRATPSGPQAYLRGTRVAVRHIAAFLMAGHSAEEIVKEDLPHLTAAAIYEAIAYYYDHKKEIEEELASNSKEAVQAQLRGLLTKEEYARLTRPAA
jgi:uncharacterized protein (DUF433 family)